MLGLRRNTRSVRLSAVAAAATALILGVSACGSSSSSAHGSSTSGSVTWWGWTPQPNNATDYIKAFNAQYPKITVTYKQVTIDGWNAALRSALASGHGPDVFDIAPGAGMAAFAGSAVDLTSAMQKQLGTDWKTKVASLGIAGLSTGSKLAGVSVGSTSAGSLWVNSALFSKYNLKPPTTLAEWASDCKVFQQHGVGCFVQGVGQVAFDQDTLQAIADSVAPGMWTKAEKGQVKWTDPVFVQALTIWKKMFDEGIFEKGSLAVQQYPDASNDFLSQKYAMVMMGTWYMQYSTVAGMTAAISAAGVGTPKPFTIVPIDFPDVAGQGNKPSLFGDSDYGLAVNSKSPNQAPATTFATWLGTSKVGQQSVADALNDIAALQGVAPNWANVQLVNPAVQKPALQSIITAATSSNEPRLSPVSADLQTAIGVAATTVAAGKATPEQAVQTLQTTAASAG